MKMMKNVKMNKIRKKLRIFISILTGLCLLTICTCSQRQSEEKIENVKLANGKSIKINLLHSKKRYYGSHHIGFGGGDHKFKLSFEHKKKNYIWKSNRSPILVNYYKNKFYVAAVYWNTEISEVDFIFYIFDGDWKEIFCNSFPHKIAIQNIGLSENTGYYQGAQINEFQIVDRLDPKDPLFRESLTAKLWLKLEKGSKYRGAKGGVNKDFLYRFKKKLSGSNRSNITSEKKTNI